MFSSLLGSQATYQQQAACQSQAQPNSLSNYAASQHQANMMYNSILRSDYSEGLLAPDIVKYIGLNELCKQHEMVREAKEKLDVAIALCRPVISPSK